MKLTRIFIVLALLFSSSNALAADIASEVRSHSDEVDLSDGGYLSFNLHARYSKGTWQHKNAANTDYNDTSWTFDFTGAYRYKGFLIEAEKGSFDGLNLGYTFWNNNNWVLDILASQSPGQDDPNKIYSELSEKGRNDRLLERAYSRRALHGLGFRSTGYIGSYILQTRALYSDGPYGSLRVGRAWQLRNWNVYSVVSAEYHSEAVNEHLYGINAVQSTQRFQEYRPEAGSRFSGTVGFEYPLSEHWVFDGSFDLHSLSSAEKNSPMNNGNSVFTQTRLSLSFVF